MLSQALTSVTLSLNRGPGWQSDAVVHLRNAATLAEPPSSLYHLLNWLQHTIRDDAVCILATGSRLYGTPQPDSDWDWVLYGTLDQWVALRHFADTCSAPDREVYGEYASPGLTSAMRFGPVNIIFLTELWQWRAWDEGTQQLLGEALTGPVTRDRAVEVYQEAFRKWRN